MRKGRNVALSPGFASALLILFAWKKKYFNGVVVNTSNVTGVLSGLGKVLVYNFYLCIKVAGEQGWCPALGWELYIWAPVLALPGALGV